MKIRDLLEEKGFLTESDLFEMANVSPEESGLPYVVFISPKGSAKHGIRIKVSNVKGKMAHTDVFSITYPELRIIGQCKLDSKSLQDIIDWLQLNGDTITGYWNYELSTKSVFNLLKNI